MPAPPLPTNLLLTQNLCGNPKWEMAARRADEGSLLIIASLEPPKKITHSRPLTHPFDN